MTVASPPAAPERERLVPGTLAHFCEWAGRLTLPSHGVRGQGRRRLVIEPFQRLALADYFDGVDETFVVLPKGNAKSTLMAVVALYHLVHTEEAEAYILAASRDQATRLLNNAAGFVRRSPGLRKRVVLKLGSREIRSRVDGGTLKVVAADPATADGIAPTLVLCDELHRWRTLEVYTLAKEGLGKRPGRLIGISTAGEDEATEFGRMRAEALKHTTVQDGAYTYAPAPSGEFVWHEWSLPPSADIEDMELVKSANPLAQITVKDLRARFDSPGTRRAWWARFVCNIWTRDDDAAISAMDWAPCIKRGCRIPDGADGVMIGADFGWRRDTTAIVPVWAMDLDPLLVRVDVPWILKPPGEGKMTPEGDVWDVFEEIARRWPDAKVVLDPNASGEVFAQRIENELGLLTVIQAQDPAPMAHAAGVVMELVRAKRLEHPGDLDFSSHVLAAYLRTTGGEKQRFDKGPAGAPIDAAIALAMACRQLSVAAGSPAGVVPFVM